MENKKVEAGRDAVRYLIQALHSTIGNKRYLHDLEKLLEEKLKDLDSSDEQTLLYLAHDISDIGNDASNAKKKFW